MERLPYIDQHVITVDANKADTWAAVLRMWCHSDDVSRVKSPFFALDAATPMQRLALKGRHWFAVYKLAFELDEEGPTRTSVRARTWADFPGIDGKIYRTLVIGTGGHRIAVELMLRRIAAQARAHGATTS